VPPSYSIQYYAQGGIQRYHYMQTTRFIKRGEEIIREQPLTELLLSLTQLHDGTALLIPGVQRNGFQTVQDSCDQMSAQNQDKFRCLYNARAGKVHAGNQQASNDILSWFRTNSSTDEQKVQATTFRF
jgi:hypothetical protein